MDETEAYLAILKLGYFEVTEAFGGMADENVWKRPAPDLLSVGELAGHVAYWEAARFAGKGEENPSDLGKHEENSPLIDHQVGDYPITSPLIDHRFSYYPRTLATPPSEKHLALTAAQVCQELLRIHAESVAAFKSRNPALDSTPPGWPSNNTYRHFLQYAAFHISYHTGQMYTARHLLGETPPDN